MNKQSQKILVVDDDRDILDAIAITLEYAGYQIKTSEKAEYAEGLVDSDGSLPKLIILDVLLSGKDGREICKKLKSQGRTQNIPVIMISAHPSAKDSVQDVGADDFLAKPFEMNDLLKKVAKYVGTAD